MSVKVASSYTMGTIINLEACDTYNFLMGIAATTIVQCKRVACVEDKTDEANSRFWGVYDDLISQYCPGVCEAIFSNMIRQNADILYAFVEDCIQNETVKGLYLFNRKSKYGNPGYKLITLALDEYMEMAKRYYENLGLDIPKDCKRYNMYNEEFEKMFL